MRMRIRTNQGSALLITLVTVGIIGLSMAAYLDVLSSHNLATMRSIQWNSAIPVAEAGVEEALTHLHHNPLVRAVNGWSLVNGVYTKERTLGESKYVTSLSTNYSPEIISKAYVRRPLSMDYLDPPRTLKIVVTNHALFAKGMVAKGQIDLNGNNITSNSFDSADPNYSSSGMYDPAKFKDEGDIATNSTFTNSFSVGNAKIYGKVATGPGASAMIGTSGVVGAKAWHQAGNSGIQPGWSSEDMNVSFPEVQPPFLGGAFLPAPGIVGATNYTYVLTSGNWEMSNLALSGSDKMLVLGDAVLYVTGNVSLGNSAYIYIATNSVLKMYVAGEQTSLGGQGAINSNGNATNFVYFGLSSNKTVSMQGNAAFTGVIYAPSAALTLGGGGNSTYDFVGASITDTIKMNGHYNFHYDENLRRWLSRGFTIISWSEL